MKVMLTSDLHGKLDGFEENASKAELVVIAGDFAALSGRGKWHIYDQKKWIEKKFIPILEKLSNVQFAIVPGNHDFCMDQTRCNSLFAGEKDMRIKWPSNVHILLDSGCELCGLKLYGTPWVPIISWSWAFEADHDKLFDKFSNIPEGLDILVTHAPPHIPDCKIDFSMQTNYGPFGSHELAEAIYAKKPKYAISGHIHSGDHAGHCFDCTMLFNVSRLDEHYDVAYEPLWLDLKGNDEKAKV